MAASLSQLPHARKHQTGAVPPETVSTSTDHRIPLFPSSSQHHQRSSRCSALLFLTPRRLQKLFAPAPARLSHELPLYPNPTLFTLVALAAHALQYGDLAVLASDLK